MKQAKHWGEASIRIGKKAQKIVDKLKNNEIESECDLVNISLENFKKFVERGNVSEIRIHKKSVQRFVLEFPGWFDPFCKKVDVNAGKLGQMLGSPVVADSALPVGSMVLERARNEV